MLLDHDDLLAPEALEVVAARLDEHDDIDYLYTDEDKIAADGGRFFDRFEKPDWSPERLRWQNYCSHLSVVRRTLFERVGRFREGFDGSQDYDLILRVTEQARRIEHVDEVLYHWRAARRLRRDGPRREAVCVRRGTPGARRTLRSRGRPRILRAIADHALLPDAAHVGERAAGQHRDPDPGLTRRWCGESTRAS